MYGASNKTGHPLLYECNKKFLHKFYLKNMVLLDLSFNISIFIRILFTCYSESRINI